MGNHRLGFVGHFLRDLLGAKPRKSKSTESPDGGFRSAVSPPEQSEAGTTGSND